MIVYKNSVKGFKEDVETNSITEKIEKAFIEKYNRRTNSSEKMSWTNSMPAMERILRKGETPDSCGVLIEYNIPNTSNRIDFILTGYDDNEKKNALIIELKQWEKAESTDKDGVVVTYLGHRERETTHPSYQAYSYKQFLRDFNENIYSGEYDIESCAYLHNYKQREKNEPLLKPMYEQFFENSPIYFKDDYDKLQKFINNCVGKGDGMQILYEIENGRIRPSKKLVEYVSALFAGNKEFILLDEQKVIFEDILKVSENLDEKVVYIVEGGPGTGKSVLSTNLLASFLERKLNALFVAPNSSFRNVILQKLAENRSPVRVEHLFKGSASFVYTKEDTYDVIVVDEAHRLKKKGAYQYKGENQIEDIIKSSKYSIFFVDDNQRIRPEDIGSVEEIKKAAGKFNAIVKQDILIAQFRCAGAEGYINWVDDVLQIRETANFNGFDKEAFDFKIFDNPNELRDAIVKKVDEGLNTRILAGYAWEWTSEKGGNRDGEIMDISIDEFDFKMPWNSRQIGSTWATNKRGVHQIGCIHTSQGLEFDYVGVIVGNDLKYDPETMTFRTEWESYYDKTGKRLMKEKPEELNKLVRNIYKTLMTRGMKGCYVYFVDKNLNQLFHKLK